MNDVLKLPPITDAGPGPQPPDADGTGTGGAMPSAGCAASAGTASGDRMPCG